MSSKINEFLEAQVIYLIKYENLKSKEISLPIKY